MKSYSSLAAADGFAMILDKVLSGRSCHVLLGEVDNVHVILCINVSSRGFVVLTTTLPSFRVGKEIFASDLSATNLVDSREISRPKVSEAG